MLLCDKTKIKTGCKDRTLTYPPRRPSYLASTKRSCLQCHFIYVTLRGALEAKYEGLSSIQLKGHPFERPFPSLLKYYY